ncbi:hypothetical protein F5144DRAFT_584639 [Chaetomium tenue]|uniref:Uncharacterized protein n=1 Tax=Chaetomium tenue TaxID=1854479 RepID=A0ACB7P1Y9_9PEZI|nr:hypothetical protein F5144DRAFT_584639 [Chaetomium globosum]
MDTASDTELDATVRKRTRKTRWRQLFSRQPRRFKSAETETNKQPLSEQTPNTSVVVEVEENVTTSSRVVVNDINHDEASPATSKDERQDNDADDDDAGSSKRQPDNAETEDDDGEDGDEDGEDVDEDDEEVDEDDEDDEADEVAEDHANGTETRPLRDFWAEAWNSDEVGEKRRALLGGKKEDQKPGQTNSRKLVDGLIAKTPDKVVSYTARWGSDAEKTALGRAKSILVSALMVKDLIDAGLKFDPTGYGSAAWTVVSFGLTLVQNDKERADLTFEACGHLADLMARYSRIETHYWEGKSRTAGHWRTLWSGCIQPSWCMQPRSRGPLRAAFRVGAHV